MATSTGQRYGFNPDYAVAPGETLKETIDSLGISQKGLAERTGLTTKTINLIINGKEPISPKTSVSLERVTGVPARMWNNLESTYRNQLAKLADRKRLEADVEWLDTIPTKELIKRGVIAASKDKAELLDSVLKFFGVSTVKQWEVVWSKPSAAYRKSEKFKAEPGAIATWLRLGELAALEIETSPYHKPRFEAALNQIRALTTESPDIFAPRMVEESAAAGVAVVFVREIKKCPTSGAARWLLPDKALIQLSLRYKSDDQFWFSFFHEAGHILNDPKKEIFIDDGQCNTEREEKANRFAATWLIPSRLNGNLRELKTEQDIIAFAKRAGVSPGIVVGRLQKEGLVSWNSRLNKLKVRFTWNDK